MRSILTFLVVFTVSSAFSAPLWMRYPSISPDGNWIAFSYQGDIFVTAAEGGVARQITSHPAHDSRPIWSNDGDALAFASDRHGNFDVFLVNARGGTPSRLTHHSSNDYPYEFTKDGKNVLFESTRLDDVNSVQFPYGRLSELYTVPTTGGREKQMLTIAAEDIQVHADGNRYLFHNKKGYEDPWRKHHTSSITRDIVLYNAKDESYTQITNWNGEDRNPVWGENDSFYFLSEYESGSFNIWKGTLDNPYSQQVTKKKDHPVRFLSRASNGTLCYGYHGEIYTYKNGKSEKVAIEIYKDRSHNATHPLRISGISEFAVAPNGKEIAFIFRGEVFVTSVKYTTTKQITSTPEQERSVSFSPDGEKLLYAGERKGSWNLYEATRKNESDNYFYNAGGIEESVLLASDEETFQPAYSPDGKEVAFLENRTTIRVINVKSKKVRTVMDGKHNYSYSDGDQYFAWAPDSKWIVTQFFEFDRWNSDIGLVNASGKEKPINLTKSGYGNGSPKFAMEGEMIYFTTDRYGMRSHGSWGAQSDVQAIFLTEEAYQRFRLNKEEFELWKEEESEAEKEKAEDDTEEKDKDKKEEEDEEEKVEPIKLEKEGLEDRQIRLTIHSSNLANFLVNEEGTQLFYLTRFEGKFNLWKTDFKEKTTKQFSPVNTWSGGMAYSKDQKHIFISTGSGIAKVIVADGSKESVSYSGEMTHNPSAERAYMFEHAWRQAREKFYVEDLHGVDWDMYKAAYLPFLEHINNGYDFSELLSELLGELNASHTGARYGNYDPNGDQTATFGAFLDEDFKGDGLKIIEIMDKSPLKKSDKVKDGDIILKIDGTEIKAGENYYPLLNRKIGKKVRLTFKDGKTGDTWSENFKLISNWSQLSLAYERWVKKSEETVAELSDGKLGYVHIRGMDSPSFRTLYDKALGEYNTKDALIIDTRFNGGGWLHDDLATFLSGKLYMSFEPRGQTNMGGEPISKWQKPSCVLMSEGNYSDAHLFPYTYKALGIGKLIGMPVPGTGTAVWWERMIDGKTVFGIPQVGMRSVTEGFLVENHDLEPDIKVDNSYEAFTNGEDEQLKKAIEVLLKQ